MGSLGRGAENRKSYRCRTSETNDLAELRIGQRRIPVQLRDESAGGFGVTAAERPEVERTDVLQLHVDSTVFNVRLVHLHEERVWERGQERKIYCIGLQRLGEAEEPPTAEPAYRHLASAALRWLFPSGHVMASPSGFVLAVVVVGAPLAFAALFYHFCRTSATSLGAPIRAEESAVQPAARSAGEQPAGPGSASRSIPADTALKASSGAADWATIARLPGAAPLLTSSMIRSLGLSEDQQRRIREIVDETTEAFKQVDAQFQGSSRQEQSRVERILLEAAREKALGLLTPEQRGEFQAVLDKSRRP
jgi:hypothetical protein